MAKSKKPKVTSFATAPTIGGYAGPRNITPAAPDLGLGKITTPIPVNIGGSTITLPAPSLTPVQRTPVAPSLPPVQRTPITPPTSIINKATSKKSESSSNTGVKRYKPEEFIKEFRVGEPYTREDWGGVRTWDDLYDSEDFWLGPLITKPGEIDGGNMPALEDDIEKRGIKTPVIVDWETKEVMNGHHRVIAALNVGAKIPVVFINKPEKEVRKNAK